MGEIRILVVDDHEVVRRGVRALLESHPGWVCCGEAANGREAVEKVKQLQPGVVVMDTDMPELNGLEATRQILKVAPAVEVLILTAEDSEQAVREAMSAGARGYILKTDSGSDLMAAVAALSQRKLYLNMRVANLVMGDYLKPRRNGNRQDFSRSQLTAREREVVQLLGEGKSNKEVAAHLNISVNTVEAHRANIMHKLGLHSMSDLVRYAVRNLIIQA